MEIVIINPGSGPVDNAQEKYAIDNIEHFITDCKVDNLIAIRIPTFDYGEGRFAFLIWKEGSNHCHEVQMPGLPLEKVRFMDVDRQNILDFPRLYTNGSSWVWKFGLFEEEDFED